jgi:hypothetical protein
MSEGRDRNLLPRIERPFSRLQLPLGQIPNIPGGARNMTGYLCFAFRCSDGSSKTFRLRARVRRRIFVICRWWCHHLVPGLLSLTLVSVVKNAPDSSNCSSRSSTRSLSPSPNPSSAMRGLVAAADGRRKMHGPSHTLMTLGSTVTNATYRRLYSTLRCPISHY